MALTRCGATCCPPSTTGGPTGPTTRGRAATASTRRTCGWSRGSPTATRPRSWRRCSPPAPSTAGTAPAWTWSATTCPRWRSTASRFPSPSGYAKILDYLRRTPERARRGGLRRRRGQPAHPGAGELRQPAARHPQHPRHPPGLQGPSWLCRSTSSSRRCWPGCSAWRRRRSQRGVHLALHTHVNHARQLTPLVQKASDAMLDMGFRDVRNQGVLLRGVNATAKDLLELCFTLPDHAHDPAVLLLHVRHDPQLRALADVGRRGPAAAARHHGLPAGVRHAADRLRRALRRQALGAPDRRLRSRARHLLLDQELPDRHRAGRPRRRSTAATSTTTRCTPCPRPASSTGGSRPPPERGSDAAFHLAGPLPRGELRAVGRLALADAPRRPHARGARPPRSAHRGRAPRLRGDPGGVPARHLAVLPLADRPGASLLPGADAGHPHPGRGRRPSGRAARSARRGPPPPGGDHRPQVPRPGALPRPGQLLHLLPPLHPPAHHPGR